MPGFASFMYLEIADLPPMPVHTCTQARRHRQAQTCSVRISDSECFLRFVCIHEPAPAACTPNLNRTSAILLQPWASGPRTAVWPHTHARFLVRRGAHTRAWRGMGSFDRASALPLRIERPAPAYLRPRHWRRQPHGAAGRASQPVAAALCYRARGVPRAWDPPRLSLLELPKELPKRALRAWAALMPSCQSCVRG
jgi:hypothetical protein